MKKVVKFGGSSLASAEQFRKVGDIVRAEEDRRYVVPSAPGKRYSADTKVTDMLIALAYKCMSGKDNYKTQLEAVVERYPRDSYVIADKLPLFLITSEDQLEPIFSEQLERTGLDCFDY